MADQNKYVPEVHDDYVTCPRPNCRERNAPPDSDEFYPRCWNCNEHLDIQPVHTGDEVILDIDDIHSNGAGVGHTDDGFVVLIDGILPEKRVKARVTNVKQNFAWGEVVEVIADEIPEEDESEDEATDSDVESEESEYDDEPEREALGRRDDWWGR